MSEFKHFNSENLKEQKQTQFQYISHKFGISNTILIIALVFYYQYYLTLQKFDEIEKQHIVYGLSDDPVFFGRKMDISDGQLKHYLKFLPLILVCMPVFLILSMVIKMISPKYYRQIFVQMFHVAFGFPIALFILRKYFAVFTIITMLNFIVTKLFFKKNKLLILIWVINIAFMCSYQLDLPIFNSILQKFEYLGEEMIYPSLIFGFTILRMISFSTDLHWCENEKAEKYSFHQDNLKDRMTRSGGISKFNLLSYYAYILYTPIFITGPQLTFNAYSSQCERGQFSYSTRQIIFYIIRTMFCFFTLILFITYFHVNAIAKNDQNEMIRVLLPGFYKYNLCFLNLVFIWLKYICIWRLPRACALIDGFDTPENMGRCIYNNYCFESFWRSWHRGFNLWLIRYIFIPLGGSKYKNYNIWIVFTFVALWHEFNFNLLLWVWGICLVLIPEYAIKKYMNQNYLHLWKDKRFVIGISFVCSFEIMFMCIYNLIGFGMGSADLLELMNSMLTREGLKYLFGNLTGLAMLTISGFYFRQFEEDESNY